MKKRHLRMNQQITNKYGKHRSRRLLLMLVLMFALGITLITSTYAWFTSNRIATVWLMDVKVAAQNGIEISANAVDWKTEIAIEDLEDAHLTYPSSVNQLPTILEPVSTIGEVESGYLKMFYGKVENARGSSTDFTLRTIRVDEERGFGDVFDGKFLAFDIFLKTTTPTSLYLSNESGVTYNGEESAGLENSMRFAFVVEGNVETTSPVSITQLLRTNSRSDVYIWEPNYNSHTEAAIENASNVYGMNISAQSNPLPYEGVKAEIPKSAGVMINTANKANFPAYFDNVRVDYTTRVDFTDNIEIFSIGAGITKIRVYVWIEGQDVDCENEAAVGGMSLNLQFTTNPA